MCRPEVNRVQTDAPAEREDRVLTVRIELAQYIHESDELGLSQIAFDQSASTLSLKS